MRIRCSKLVLLAVLLLGVVGVGPVWAAGAPESLKGSFKVGGDADYYFHNGKVTIARMVYDTCGYVYGGGYATFDIRGWDHFTAYVGIEDGKDATGAQRTSIEVDGEVVWQQDISSGDKAIFVDILLTGRRTITLRVKTGNTKFAEPKLYKGTPPATAGAIVTTPPATVTGGGTTTAANTPATFAVDPNDMEKLATALRKRVDANADLKDRITKGNTALMTFNLIAIPSLDVASTVAENLSTSLINADFPLVERGQLDKALKEMKLQDSGLIDPATAQQLGKVTGCDFILVGSISDQGQFVVINARFLETATGKALAAERVEMRKIDIKR